MSRNPTIGEVIRGEIRSALLATRVLQPAVVTEYNAETRTAFVRLLFKPVVRGEDGEPKAIELPEMRDVPVWWPQFGGFRLTGTLLRGEVVGLLCADRAMDNIESQTITDLVAVEPVDPVDPRMHDLSDALIVPGMLATEVGASATEPMILEHLSGAFTVEIHPDGRVLFGLGGEADQPAVRGNVLASYLTAARAHAETHTHVAPPTGGATGPAVPAPPQMPQDLLSALLLLR